MRRLPILLALLAGPAMAQTADEAVDPYAETESVEEIVVTGQRPRGAVLGDIAPEITLDSADVRALGAASITELLELIAPQTQSGRGRGGERPVTLLNGRRISGFSELRGIPPEAIERVEILPEEVALKYGFRADQRVVNIVLRPRFRSTTVDLQAGGSTGGGGGSFGADASVLRLNRQGRSSVDVEVRRTEPLLESERDILLSAPPPGVVDVGASDPRPFRTLVGESDRLSVNGTINRTVLDDVSATLNARFDLSQGESLFGLPSAGLPGVRFLDGSRPLTRRTEAQTGRLGLTLDGRVDDWRWTVTGAVDRVQSVSESDAGLDTTTLVSAADFGGLPRRAPNRGESTSDTANAALVLNGSFGELPAGSISSTLTAEVEALRLDSTSVRSGTTARADLARDRGRLALSVDVPLVERGSGPFGELSLNANMEQDQLSDFGGLTTVGFGVNWSPVSRLDLIASVTDEDAAPTMQQLGDPVLLSPNARVFDFTRGETVEVARLDGGNPLLSADNRRVLKLGATLKPFDERDLSLTLNYTANTIDNPIAEFPAITAEIEAAFPDRFIRDATGRLIQLDARPVNFARSERESLRSGLNYSRRIGPEVSSGPLGRGGARGEGGRLEGARQGGGGPRGGGGGFGGAGRFGRPSEGRLQLGLFHTYRITDTVLVAEGGPELDLLDGDAVGARGGQSRHEVEAQAGLFRSGFGARFDATWRSGTTVKGGSRGTGALDFSDLTTVNLRLFADLGQQRRAVERYPWLRGTRASLAISNAFDDRLEVRDAAGATPVNYQPDLLDPTGRAVRVSVRKLFFAGGRRQGVAGGEGARERRSQPPGRQR
jgi:hypothetical protein